MAMLILYIFALSAGRLSFVDAVTYNKLKAAKVELQINALNATPALDNVADIIAAAKAHTMHYQVLCKIISYYY